MFFSLIYLLGEAKRGGGHGSRDQSDCFHGGWISIYMVNFIEWPVFFQLLYLLPQQYFFCYCYSTEKQIRISWNWEKNILLILCCGFDALERSRDGFLRFRNLRRCAFDKEIIKRFFEMWISSTSSRFQVKFWFNIFNFLKEHLMWKLPLGHLFPRGENWVAVLFKFDGMFKGQLKLFAQHHSMKPTSIG